MTDIATDWLGRATFGGAMADQHSSDWHRAFPGKWESGELEGSGWAKDERGRYWWVTDTPDWDRRWFIAQGVRPPKRIGTYDHFTWKDRGGGLSQGVYDTRNTYPREKRDTPLAQKLDPGESIIFTVEPGDPS